MPKLEKMGLITKTIDKPFMIEAIPVEKALDSLVSRERKKAQERISHLENNLKDMVNELQEQPRIKEETRFTLLTTDEAIKNRGRLKQSINRRLVGNKSRTPSIKLYLPVD